MPSPLIDALGFGRAPMDPKGIYDELGSDHHHLAPGPNPSRLTLMFKALRADRNGLLWPICFPSPSNPAALAMASRSSTLAGPFASTSRRNSLASSLAVAPS